MRASIFYFILVIGICSCKQNNPEQVDNPLYKQSVEQRVSLPNGWSLTPQGKALPLGDLPLNLVFSPKGTYAAVTNNGQSVHSLMLFDVASERMLDSIEMTKGWLGLAFNQAEDRIYASGGNENLIWEYQIQDQQLSLVDSLVLGKSWPDDTISVAGIALDEGRQRLYAVTKENNSLYAIDLESKKIQSQILLPSKAYSCLLSKDQNDLYISLWGSKELGIVDLETMELEATISTGSHPNDMVLNSAGDLLYVACANENVVSVIDLPSRKVVEQISASVHPNSLAGSTTNGVSLSPDDEYLYIANADNNCLAVFEVEEKGDSKAAGFIPTGWYPTVVRSTGDKLWIVNGKGFGSAANPRGPNPNVRTSEETQYIGRMFTGELSILERPTPQTLAVYSKLVYENTPYTKERETLTEGKAGNPIPMEVGGDSPIKYVFYVVKENRTYDQVFGDMPEGNGDTSLCLFPREVTPNHHALAEKFVLLDNFYVDAEVSADGHNWTMGAYANDYIEKTWPTLYGGRGGTYDYEGSKEIAYPDAGYLWDFAQKAGVSYRSYGIFASYDQTQVESLKGHVAPQYPGYDLSIKDSLRVERWKVDFDSLLAINAVPRLNTIRFGNDHTAGARLGMPTPRAMVADNDLAVGKLVEYISQSPIWKESAIFVIQDDAQNGPDHVDAHRSVALVVSPYTKRNEVISEMYSTCSMLRTMELILGLPPMSQYDAAALPMFACFSPDPVLGPYTALPAEIDLNELNVDRNELSERSAKFNLETYDAVPDLPFNEVVWKTIKGIDSPLPAPRRTAYLQYAAEEEVEETETEVRGERGGM